MEIILCNYFIISKLWNTIEDKRCDLTPLFHCVTFSCNTTGTFPEVMSHSIAIVLRSHNSRMIFFRPISKSLMRRRSERYQNINQLISYDNSGFHALEFK